ncbi:putative membrane protein [Candidatus Paraburkholderia schumanniana]|nr:putative membrane protein [Candidatus Paraburkholderia schumannianae]
MVYPLLSYSVRPVSDSDVRSSSLNIIRGISMNRQSCKAIISARGAGRVVREFLPHWNATQVLMYCLGCLVFSFGAKFFIDGRLGTDPLDVLVTGLNHHLHAGMGSCFSLVAGIFLAWWTLWNRRIPPLTPFVTSAAVGFLIDLWTWLAITSGMTAALSPYLILFMGLFLCAYGSSLIIMSGIGIRIMDLVALTMIRELELVVLPGEDECRSLPVDYGMAAWRTARFCHADVSRLRRPLDPALHGTESVLAASAQLRPRWCRCRPYRSRQRGACISVVSSGSQLPLIFPSICTCTRQGGPHFSTAMTGLTWRRTFVPT